MFPRKSDTSGSFGFSGDSPFGLFEVFVSENNQMKTVSSSDVAQHIAVHVHSFHPNAAEEREDYSELDRAPESFLSAL